MDVKYKEGEWERSEKALQSLIGLGWGKGVTDYLKKINKNFEDAQHDIQKDDSDGVISFSFTDKENNYQKIFEKMETLHDYASNAGRLVERVIDEPFYKDIDKFVEKMESLSIDNYETKNTIGATQIISTGAYNYGMGPATTEVKKDKIHLKDIMAGDNFFADNLKAQFAEYSKQNPEQKFTYDQYQSAVSSSRAFAYDSIRDDQQNIEFWRDIGIAVVIIGASILCPPAGLALGIAYGTLELSSATSGKDWLTGREMDGGERTTRGAFALLDIIPGVKGIRAFSQATKAGGLVLDAAQVGSKLTLKQAGKQGLSNLDSIGKQAFRESAERVRKIPNIMKDATSAIKIQVKNGTVQAGKITDGVVTGVKNLNFSRTRVVADSIGGAHAMFDVAENTHKFEKLATGLVNNGDDIGEAVRSGSNIAWKKLKVSGERIELDWLPDGYKAFDIEGKVKVGGKEVDISRRVYQTDIDFDYVSKNPKAKGMTNGELMKKGRAPYIIDANGNESLVELHHLIQKEPGSMVEISEMAHDTYSKQLHGLLEDGASFRNNPDLEKQYNNFRSNYWKWRGQN
ncbi:HNH/ENDO VII family nuclease [Listeria booriae]|uniref:HNH/ENDO VII family nuclease n=1 Tax=Listeria booriae TaxID=1552123 RepID=UPI0021AB0F31|nr:HNH/ENDO VII family nuclease [Listeria booriae]